MTDDDQQSQTDRVAVILAASAGLSVLVLTVAAVLDATIGDQGISKEYSTLLVGTLGVLVGALAGYIGGRRGDIGPRGRPGVGTLTAVDPATDPSVDPDADDIQETDNTEEDPL